MARYYEDELYLACDCCIHACEHRKGWYCSEGEDDYFPEADWDSYEEDESECPSFEFDEDCRNDDN